MANKKKKRLRSFIAGLLVGMIVLPIGGVLSYKILKKYKGVLSMDTLTRVMSSFNFEKHRQVTEDFSLPVKALDKKSFGKSGQLTFELFRGGTFAIDGKSGYALQKSDSYRDSAFIRSTQPLPKTYKITVVVGDIDYDLDGIQGLGKDPEYIEGPQNENGCYLLAITDEAPVGHHTNVWWHQHRKLVIDVDNNVWGHGMPNPIFMVYFDKNNKLVSYNGQNNSWENVWEKAVTYEPQKFYKVEIEKTKSKFILSVYSEKGDLLKKGSVDLKDIWHEDEFHSDYFVVGDPHENYYQGSMKIKSISMPAKTR